MGKNDDIIDHSAAKRRRMEPDSLEDLENVPVSSQSTEIARMRIALDLTVQEELLKVKIKKIQTHIDEHLSMIQELETQKEKLHLEEREIYDCRMKILKEAYKDKNVLQAYQLPVERSDLDPVPVIQPPTVDKNICPVVDQNHSTTAGKTLPIPDVKTTPIHVVKASQDPVGKTLPLRFQNLEKTDPVSLVKADPVPVVKPEDPVTAVRGSPTTSLSESRSNKEYKPLVNHKSRKQDTCETLLIDVSSDDSNDVEDNVPPQNDTVDRVEKSRNITTNKYAVRYWSSMGFKRQVYDSKIFKRTLVISDENGLRRYVLDTGECSMCYTGFHKPPQCFTVRKGKGMKRWCMISGVGKTLLIHNYKTGELLHKIGFNATILSLETCHSRMCFIGCSDGRLIKLNATTNRFEWDLKFSDEGISGIRPNKDRTAVIATTDGKLFYIGSDKRSLPRDGFVPIGEADKALDSRNIVHKMDTVYTIEDGKLKEISVFGDFVKKARAFDFKITTITSLVNKSPVLIFGCEDGNVRIFKPLETEPRIHVINTRNETSIVSLMMFKSCVIYARDINGKILYMKMPHTGKDCEVAGCNLSFSTAEDVIEHVFREHVLSSRKKTSVKCYWNNECKHRLYKSDFKGVEAHIRSHL